MSNDDSFAVGQNNTVGGTIGFAVGSQNKVEKSKSVAIGDANTLSAESTQAIGTLNQVSGKYSIALGVKCRANDSGSFVWSGSDKNFAALFPVYYSHGKGTFNVNPVSGAAGFYIGEKSLSSMLSDIHEDYISDAAGNKINADLSCTIVDDNSWTVTDPNSNSYVLDNIAYRAWEYVDADNIKLEMIYSGNEWVLSVYSWVQDPMQGTYDWELSVVGYSAADMDATDISDFTNQTQTNIGYTAHMLVIRH